MARICWHYDINTSRVDAAEFGDGRASCLLDRQGGDYLLVLKLVGSAYTADWYALGPTNEQLHSDDDPWLQWVRRQVGPRISALR